MALGKGIPVINGFDLNSKLPLDSRAVADTMEEMNALVTNGSVTDGQLCYLKEDKKLYVLKDGVWSEVGSGGSKVGSIELTNEQFNGYQNNSFTLTDEQFNIIKNNDFIIINSTVALSETETVNISELYNKTYLSQTFNGQVSTFYGLINYIEENIKLLTVQDKNASLVTFRNIDNYVSDISIIGNNFNVITYSDTSNVEYYYMMYINHKPVISKEAVSIDLPDAKTIPLFDNHSILVPKDSADANILPLPSDASTSTYVLKAVNGTVQWVKES